MSLENLIHVNTNYTRSINLERDYHSSTLIQSYIPTSRTIYALEKALSTLDRVTDMPRAWSLVGPYGSGKSSFAVFLSHLLANPELPETQIALNILKKSNPELGANFSALSHKISGHCVVLLTGSPEPLGKRLIKSIHSAVQDYYKNSEDSDVLNVIQNIYTLSEKKQASTTEIINIIKELQTIIGITRGNGLLIIIDELGKFLEYEARHSEINDIYLLQALAELAYTGGEAALSIYVILHQSFDQYAKGLGHRLKNEWAKIYGRFESIPFLETSEQTLRVVAKAIEHTPEVNVHQIKQYSTHIAKTLAEIKALPSALDKETAAALFTQCYPLHPISALLLPVLCQKVAQNERTLFNYLGSSEQFGFQKSLATLKKLGDWIYPWEIYEYFISNQSAAVSDHITHRRWAEVVTAVDRLGNIDSNETRLLKAIGLLNIIGSQGGLKASQNIIEYCLPEKGLANKVIESLIVESVIQFRKYNNEYRVWQGSDFDIEAAIISETQKLGFFSVADYLNTRHTTQAIIARKFSIQTGTLRYFEIIFIDSTTYKTINIQNSQPRIIIYLSYDQDDSYRFQSKITKYYSDTDIVTEFLQAEELREVITELFALEKIQKSNQKLQSDPIAQHEFKDCYQTVARIEAAKFAEIIDHPEKSHWYWKGQKFRVASKRHLQNKLSALMGDILKCTPIIKNELINRIKPSSQAVAGRNKLLYAMLMQAHKEDLGIEKFPAEKSMYRAVLRETGIHVKIGEDWQFTRPKHGSVVASWEAMETFLETSEKIPRPFSELADILTSPPYGIKAGLLPVFYLALYLVNKDDIALYEDRHYLPSLSKEHLERFVKKPKGFTLQLFKIEGLNAALFKHYADALFPQKAPKTVIQAIAPLAQFINNLNEYSKKTMQISKHAQAFRNAFNLAKSPESLLFKGIPHALGYKKINQTNLAGYADTLKGVIRELKYAHDHLLQRQQKLLAQAFKISIDKALAILRIQLRQRYLGLDQYTVDTDGLKAFLNRLVENTGTDKKWFQSLLMLLGSKATDKWKDIDQNRAEMKLSDYSRRILDLEKLHLEHEKTLKSTKQKGDFDIILLKTLKKGQKERTEAVAINTETHEAALKIKNIMSNVLAKEDKILQLAILAELVDDFLVEYQTSPQIELNFMQKNEPTGG